MRPTLARAGGGRERAGLVDEGQLIALAKQGRQQLEELWARERAENRRQRERAGWQAPQADAAPEEVSADRRKAT